MDGYGRVLAEDNEFTLHDLAVLDTASAVQWGAANNDTSIMHRAYPALAPLRSAAADAVHEQDDAASARPAGTRGEHGPGTVSAGMICWLPSGLPRSGARKPAPSTP
jgi:hypothetical protein